MLAFTAGELVLCPHLPYLYRYLCYFYTDESRGILLTSHHCWALMLERFPCSLPDEVTGPSGTVLETLKLFWQRKKLHAFI